MRSVTTVRPLQSCERSHSADTWLADGPRISSRSSAVFWACASNTAVDLSFCPYSFFMAVPLNAGYRPSCQNIVQHCAVHVGEPEVAPLIPMRQPQMVEPEQMQDRGLQVIDGHRF